jgi:Ca-activated chloride channel family protein
MSHPAPSPPERTAFSLQQPFADMHFKSYGVNPTIDTE